MTELADDLVVGLERRREEDGRQRTRQNKTEQDKTRKDKMGSVDGLGRRLLNETDSEDLVEVWILWFYFHLCLFTPQHLEKTVNFSCRFEIMILELINRLMSHLFLPFLQSSSYQKYARLPQESSTITTTTTMATTTQTLLDLPMNPVQSSKSFQKAAVPAKLSSCTK